MGKIIAARIRAGAARPTGCTGFHAELQKSDIRSNFNYDKADFNCATRRARKSRSENASLCSVLMDRIQKGTSVLLSVLFFSRIGGYIMFLSRLGMNYASQQVVIHRRR